MKTISISKPYANEHAARLFEPDEFKPIRVGRTEGSGDGKVQGVKVPKTISVIWFIQEVEGEEVPRAQALRFPTENWTEAEAKKWLKDNEIKYVSFEPAKEEKSKNTRIEDLTSELAKSLNDSDLKKLRFRFTQLFDKYFAKNADIIVGSLNREDILQKYAILVQEMKVHKIGISTKNIDRDLFKKNMKSRNQKEVVEKYKGITILVNKADEERIVCGIVYEPDEIDTQGDTASAEDIRKAAHRYMETSQAIKMNHEGSKIAASVLESYIAPQELSIAGRVIKKGTWMMSMRINDTEVWKKIRDGELTGFSMAGSSLATELE